jgi:hypothetical protein
VRFQKSPAATSWGPNRLDVFGLGTDGVIYHVASNSGALNWEPLPGPGLPTTQFFLYSPDAVSWGAGNLQVWATIKGAGIPPGLVMKSFDLGGSWTAWQTITLPNNALPVSKVAVASAMATGIAGSFRAAAHVHIVNAVYLDGNQKLRLGTYFDGSGMIWNSSAFTPQSNHVNINPVGDPEIAISAPGRIDVFVRDAGGTFYDCPGNQYDFANTSPQCTSWGNSAVGGFTSNPGVVGMGDNRLMVVGTAAGGPNNQSNTAYEAFLNNGNKDNWTLANGLFHGSLDLASY